MVWGPAVSWHPTTPDPARGPSPQFDFLKPTHYLLPYFTTLVDAYFNCLCAARGAHRDYIII